MAQKGYFILTDISGYTEFLTKSELDHAQDALQNLFDAQLAQLLDVAEELAVDFVLFFLVGHASRAVKGSRSAGSLAKRPGGFHGMAGSWKSDPVEAAKP